MKKIGFGLFLMALLFSTAMAADYVAYSVEKKDPLLGGLAEVLLPAGIGHLYAGDWGGYLPFLGAEVGGLVLVVASIGTTTTYSGGYYYSTATVNGGLYLAGLAVIVAAEVWDVIDVVNTIDKNNKVLKTKFGITMRDNMPVLETRMVF